MSAVTPKPLKVAMEEAGMHYVGEATMYCRHLRHDCINGVAGSWLRHEFGADEVFRPSTTDRGYHNSACYAKVSSPAVDQTA